MIPTQLVANTSLAVHVQRRARGAHTCERHDISTNHPHRTQLPPNGRQHQNVHGKVRRTRTIHHTRDRTPPTQRTRYPDSTLPHCIRLPTYEQITKPVSQRQTSPTKQTRRTNQTTNATNTRTITHGIHPIVDLSLPLLHAHTHTHIHTQHVSGVPSHPTHTNR